MSKIKSIRLPIEKEFKEFEAFFKKTLKSEIPLLHTILNFLYRTKGKQLRPMFVFLSAKMHGDINEFTKIAACSIELLHTGTLVHDDVVDESYERRGTFSINALWRNKLAVLTGDYILAKGLMLQAEYEKFNFLHLISRAVQEMSEGEILQIKKSRRLNIDEATYFEIIRKKTASLIATSMALGAASVTDNQNVIEKMYEIGLDAGVVFQIKDDIFDYHPGGVTGKPAGNDIREKKITLPLLYVLNNTSSVEKKRMLKLIRRGNSEQKNVDELIQLVADHGGIDYAKQKMHEIKEKALNNLANFPESDARASLMELIEYITTRKK